MSVFSAVLRVFRRQVQVKRRAAEMIKRHRSQAYELAVRESANDWPSGRGDFYRDVAKAIRRRESRAASAPLNTAIAPASPEGDASLH